ncbi:acyl-CoA thioesterase [Pseudonocardia nigra]|uniref:acyl-CoA thioesterase n=1 Tax=Pseudonocardia nigra TaxID=1921578 RepID=UPI0027E286F8|nr:acyl-CoA thioesterase domain-containing protein [Pseudonocardia nigra]
MTLLDLEPLDRDLFRATTVFDDPYPLYGGQVAAQALVAAGRTVRAGRLPHSMHGYFLRSGDAARPTLFRVDRDRDGRSFSARRVVAVQDGEVVFSMSASFHDPEDGLDRQVDPAPEVPAPATLPPLAIPRLFSFEARLPPQPHDGPAWPTRFWARCTERLPADDVLHAAVLTYLSDIMSGLSPLAADGYRPSTSLDHAVWFHRAARLDDWVLVDLVPKSTGGGRGWYTGTLSSRDGVLRASIAQESLFRRKRQPFENVKGRSR